MSFFQYKRFNKYNNRRTEYKGYYYASRKEADYAQELDMRVRIKDIKEWEKQKTIHLNVNGIHICDYRIDFIIYHNDKTTEYVEIKGMELPEWKMKWRLLEAMFLKEIERGEVKLSLVK